MTPTPGQLRIWHNSQFGEPNFEQDVSDVPTAILLLDTLAAYDLYQGDRVVANAQGLMVWEGGEWVDWERGDGASLDDVRYEEEGSR